MIITNGSVHVDVSFTNQLTEALIQAKVSPRDVSIFLELRGINGEAPKSLRSVSRGLSGERIRQIVQELESGPLRKFVESTSANALREAVKDTLVIIEQYAPGSDDAIRIALEKGACIVKSPASVVRMADVIGCHHRLRLTGWTSRSKYKHDEPGTFAAPEDDHRRVTVTAIVPMEMPEVFDSFINFSRKFSRGSGVVGAGFLADRFSSERGVAISQPEAVAFLTPFAVHLGRHNGDDWFSFFNSANDFLRKTSTRVNLFGQCSFELLCDFHRRQNRSLYAGEDNDIPNAVLHSAIELAGYVINEDSVSSNTNSPAMTGTGRGASEMQTLMVKIFRETLQTSGTRKSVSRSKFMAAMKYAGIRESTAHIYLGNQGLFLCKKGKCRLTDEIDKSVQDTPKVHRSVTKRHMAGMDTTI